MSNRIYEEDNIDEFGVSNIWYNSTIETKIYTRKGTVVELVRRPGWGLACYMDNSIQSCEVDERIYHESLVHPVMTTVDNPKRVAIFGGGEGATLREVLKWSSIEIVDMYDWDEDVIQLFKTQYGQWAKGAWDDERVNLHIVDIFERIKEMPPQKYDVIIIDLFDPTNNNLEKWRILLGEIQNWIKKEGAVVMYSGMRNILEREQSYDTLKDIILNTQDWHGIKVGDIEMEKEFEPYKVYIPSFSGESTFLMLKSNISSVDINKIPFKTHLSEKIWESYKVFNW